jgi:hypothetical protein
MDGTGAISPGAPTLESRPEPMRTPDGRSSTKSDGTILGDRQVDPDGRWPWTAQAQSLRARQLSSRAWSEFDKLAGDPRLGTPSRGLQPREVADYEEQVHQPECEPDAPDGKKTDREEDQARIQE